jgi:hypothetical protein
MNNVNDTVTDGEMTNNDEVLDVVVKPEAILPEQEIGALRKVHQFLSDFDRVPGSLSAQWSQMLDTVAIVTNSLIAKLPKDDESSEA